MKRSSNDDSKSNTAAASEAGRATVGTVARESEGGSKKHSSIDEQRVTAATSMDKSALVDMMIPETEGGTTVCSSEAAFHEVALLFLSPDVGTGGRLHFVGKMMKKQVQKHS